MQASSQGSVTQVWLDQNNLVGTLPGELGTLSQLTHLSQQDNALTGSLPRTLMRLANLQHLDFSGQVLCAPDDVAFQTWLNNISTVLDPTCSPLALSSNIPNQSFARAHQITPLVLPEATGGVPPITYSLPPTRYRWDFHSMPPRAPWKEHRQ